MKVKVSEAPPMALNWMVAKAGGGSVKTDHKSVCLWMDGYSRMGMFNYSTNWSQGGPIIEREGIELLCNLTAVEAERFSKSRADWQAFYRHRRRTEERSYATTPLVAAMRCYVASKLGDEVDVPETLL